MAPKSRRDPPLGIGLGRGLVPPVIDDEDDRNFWHTVILKVRTGTIFGRLSIKFWAIWGGEVYRRVVNAAANSGPSKDPERLRLMSCGRPRFVRWIYPRCCEDVQVSTIELPSLDACHLSARESKRRRRVEHLPPIVDQYPPSGEGSAIREVTKTFLRRNSGYF